MSFIKHSLKKLEEEELKAQKEEEAAKKAEEKLQEEAEVSAALSIETLVVNILEELFDTTLEELELTYSRYKVDLKDSKTIEVKTAGVEFESEGIPFRVVLSNIKNDKAANYKIQVLDTTLYKLGTWKTVKTAADVGQHLKELENLEAHETRTYKKAEQQNQKSLLED